MERVALRKSNAGGLACRHSRRHVDGVNRLSFVIPAILAMLPFPSVAQEAEDVPGLSSGPPSAKVVVIPVRAQIAKPELYILRRGIKDAIENKVDTIILDMETPGGALDVTFEMLKALEKFPGKTVTYINSEAISAGALISAGTDEIHFAPTGLIGAAAPVLATGGEIDETMRAKIVSYLRARVRAISEGKGYRGEVVSAMIDMDYEFKIGDEVIKPKGELLTLTATEAVKTYGDPPEPLLASGIHESLEDLMDALHGKGAYTFQQLEVTWSEKLAQYLTSLAPLLLAAGMVLLFIEFKTPGFGIFGVGGGILLGIVFFGHYAAGLSGHEPALFFALGLLLVFIELFFFPGIFVLIITGALLMLGSLVWSMADFWPEQPLDLSGGVLVGPLVNVMTGVILALVIFLGLLRYLPKGGLWGRMVLDGAVKGEPDGIHALNDPLVADHRSLVGRTGTAVTSLFPSGQVEIDGKRYEARLAVGFAEPGTPVRVTGRQEFGLSVEVLQ
jgi:membrane-bound serine protease (ClpP class)